MDETFSRLIGADEPLGNLTIDRRGNCIQRYVEKHLPGRQINGEIPRQRYERSQDCQNNDEEEEIFHGIR